MIVPFATQSYQSASLPVSAQRTVNAYAEMQPQDAKTQVAVFQWPGIIDHATCGTGPVRGFHVLQGRLYAFSGQSAYLIDRTGTATEVGTNLRGAGRVSTADNGTQVAIATGTEGYVLTADGLERINDPDFEPAATVEYFDSYFVFDRVGKNQIALSGLLEGLDYDALDFVSAEVSSDPVKAVIRRQDSLLVVGERTVETMYDDPVQDVPLTRIGGGLVDRGTVASHSVIKADNAVWFLGEDRVFYRLDGITPKRVSNHAIEAAWRSYDVVSDAQCDVIEHDGHKFIIVTFPTQLVTWVFDIATNLWHEKESWDSADRSYRRWRGNCVATCYGMTFIGDAFSGKVGVLDSDTYTEFGNTLPVKLIGAPLHADRKRLFFNRFELDIETGVGLTTGQGSNPQVMLESSDDGGRTWNSPQLWQSLGAIGEHGARLRWLREGSSYQRIYQVTKTDPVKFVLIAANADVSAGA